VSFRDPLSLRLSPRRNQRNTRGGRSREGGPARSSPRRWRTARNRRTRRKALDTMTRARQSCMTGAATTRRKQQAFSLHTNFEATVDRIVPCVIRTQSKVHEMTGGRHKAIQTPFLIVLFLCLVPYTNISLAQSRPESDQILSVSHTSEADCRSVELKHWTSQEQWAWETLCTTNSVDMRDFPGYVGDKNPHRYLPPAGHKM